MNLTHDWKTLLLSYLAPRVITSVEDALHVIRHSYAHSLIDLYEAFILFARTWVTSKQPTEDNGYFLNLLTSLSDEAQDERLSSILFLFTNGKNGACSSFDKELYEIYLQEGTLDSKRIESIIFSAPNIGNYILATRFRDSFADSKTLVAQLILHLHNVLSNDVSSEVSLAFLEKYSFTFSGIDFFESLNAIASRECLNVPVGIETFSKEVTTFEQRIAFSTATHITYHPLLLAYLPQITQRILINQAYEVGEFESLNFPYTDTESIDSDNYRSEQALIRSIELINAEQYESARMLLNTIDAKRLLFKNVGIRSELYCLLKEEKIKECLELAIQEYLKNPSNFKILPVKELADVLDRNRRKELRAHVSVPMLFEIYSRHIDGAYESVLRPTVTGAILGNGVSRPSQLELQKNGIPKDKLIYFLLNLCQPELIYMAGGYQSTEDLLEERVKIFRWLIKLDEENKDSYEEQIVDVTRQIVLNLRRAQVEESKIELNIDGFSRSAEKRVRENYLRYKALIEAGIDSINDAAIPKNNSGQGIALFPKAIPENEVNSLFESMVNELLSIFIKDENFGLDGYLSTRIRLELKQLNRKADR